MRKREKRLLTLLLVVGMVLSLGMPAFAAAKPAPAKKLYKFSCIKASKKLSWGHVPIKGIKRGMKVRNLKSSNKKIAVPKWAYVDIDPNSFSKEVDVFCKKTGTAKISGSVYKDGKKLSSFSFKVKIYKYASPVKSFKIGKRDLAKKIKKEPAAAMRVTGSKKFKISVKANTGWKVKSLKLEKYTMEGKIVSKKIKNGKTVKINKNDMASIVAKLYNKKQGRYQEVQVLLSKYV